MRFLDWLIDRFRPRPRPPVSPVPPAPPTPPTGDGARLLLAQINRTRGSEGLASLLTHEGLFREAQAHAEYMARTRTLTHDGWQERLARQGFQQGSENVAAGQRTAEECVASWLTSSGHRANVLGAWTVAGCGAARATNDIWYWCALFA